MPDPTLDIRCYLDAMEQDGRRSEGSKMVVRRVARATCEGAWRFEGIRNACRSIAPLYDQRLVWQSLLVFLGGRRPTPPPSFSDEASLITNAGAVKRSFVQVMSVLCLRDVKPRKKPQQRDHLLGCLVPSTP
ncbi:hypothetical protein EJ08DRAFT_659262 [Tothia fuscella]|uniref:Uncharacterized protein n=1 Tax=Tothia fuscella TaxID=1048955 RepID=A0A9P4TZ96_9PEZI|nr:hypothetical protein EJ08DRAFT_659262 [Tothia fuscella]